MFYYYRMMFLKDFDQASFYKITEFGSDFNCLASIHRTNHILTKLFPIYVLIVFYYLNLFTS